MTIEPTVTPILHKSTSKNSLDRGLFKTVPRSVVVTMLKREPITPAVAYIEYGILHAPKYKLSISAGNTPTIRVIKHRKNLLLFCEIKIVNPMIINTMITTGILFKILNESL